MLQKIIVLAAVGCSIVWAAPDTAWSQFQDMARRIPSGANTMILIDPQVIMATPLAKKENWRENMEKAAAAGISIVTPNTNQLLMAGHIDFEVMHPTWQVAISNLKYEPSMTKIAARIGGSVDRIAERDAALLPEDAYAVRLGKTLAGVMLPGNRQSVARWLRQTDVGGPRLPDFLKKELDYAASKKLPIMMTMDLTDVLSADLVKHRLKDSAALKGKDVDVDKLAEAISSIKGVTLAVSIGNQIHGAIKVEFGTDVEFMGEFAKDMLLEVLGRQGAMIDEFADWDLQIAKDKMQIKGPLYRSGMQRILSVLDAPKSWQYAASSQSEEGSEESLKRLNSQQYFNSVSGLIDDLSKKGGPQNHSNSVTLGQVGLWCGKYAKKIDDLPILNVDEDLLVYGSFVSAGLREAETALRSSGGKSRVRELNAPAQYREIGGYRAGYRGGYGWNNWGAGGWNAYVEDYRAEVEDKVRIRTEERVSSSSSARDIMTQIRTATADTRQKMTKKYQAEF